MAVASESKGNKRDGNDDPEILLGLLSAIEQDSRVTQRSLSRDLGIALGLANAYLKRCATKGLIKVSQVPLNRYAYYLTPKGFSEKSRLTAEYLTVSFNFFRDARAQCTSLFDQAARLGWQRMVLIGAGDLAEIAVLSASEGAIEILFVVDGDAQHTRCAGISIVESVSAAEQLAKSHGRIDGFLITDTQAPQATYDGAVAQVVALGFPSGCVFSPPLLRVSSAGDTPAADGAA